MKYINLLQRLTWPLASLLIGVWVFGGVGCEKRAGRLNAPPQGYDWNASDLQDDFITMHDNALLADMSMSSAHFVSHSPELNGLGVSRLKRYKSILKLYGGTLNYTGGERNQSLVNARMEKIKDFLIASGLAEDKFAVKVGMAGGAGMRASEAIAVRTASTFCSESEDGGEEGGASSSLAGQND
ncbi:MAG: hypothetical protein JSV03_00340 [Planctomycetota bacterium]|nr:MAG: hypothetical protein JSV03_00340 [Planctomycetota bacterium]